MTRYKKKTLSNFKYCYFLFRWFLIGKYHCAIKTEHKKIYKFANKGLWLFIILSCVLTLANFIEKLK